MYDDYSQAFKEICLTLLWFIVTEIKMFFVGIYEFFSHKVFHREHRFDLSQVLDQDYENAKCLVCERPLYTFKTMPRMPVTRALGLALALLCLLTAIARADNFAGIRADSLFFLDSVYVLKVSLTQSNCDALNPCSMQIASEGGSGTVFKNLFGKPGDTISVPYNFPDTQFKTGATSASLYFFGSDGKAKDILMVKLGYKDVRPPNTIIMRSPTRRAALRMAWNGLVNGRNFK